VIACAGRSVRLVSCCLPHALFVPLQVAGAHHVLGIAATVLCICFTTSHSLLFTKGLPCFCCPSLLLLVGQALRPYPASLVGWRAGGFQRADT
jgi:hypothetical protein